MNTLLLRLEGPLQAWGTRARWSQRDTALEPTKSGIIGVLACALGWGTNQDTEIRTLSRSLRLGVRVGRPGIVIRDYHTVVGGVRSAEGKIKVNATTKEPETVVSDRFYLADASFLAALQGPTDLMPTLAEAVQNPVWPPYLGRRSCPPSVPLFVTTGTYTTLEAAMASQPLPGGSQSARAVVETDAGAGVRRDDQIDSLSRRTYGPRFTRDLTLAVPASEVS